MKAKLEDDILNCVQWPPGKNGRVPSLKNLCPYVVRQWPLQRPPPPSRRRLLFIVIFHVTIEPEGRAVFLSFYICTAMWAFFSQAGGISCLFSHLHTLYMR